MSTSNAGGGPVTATAPDGSNLAQETTAGQIAGAAETVAEAVAPGGVPAPGQPALVVVDGDPPPTFAAAPPTATEAPAIRVVGDGLDRDNNPILRVLPQDGAGVVATQGDGNEDPDSPAWKVAALIDGVLKPLATQETAEVAAASLTAINAKTPSLTLGGAVPVDGSGVTQPVSAAALPLPTGASTEATLATRASEATATSTLAAVDTLESNTDQIEAKLGTLAAQEATTAKDASVDGLEALATTGNATTSAINTKLLAALGTDFNTPVRGTATAVVAQLPSSSTPRGFTLENIDTTNDLWVGTDNTVTTANGFRISPSRARFFDLGNPNALWVISASTTAWQIGATS